MKLEFLGEEVAMLSLKKKFFLKTPGDSNVQPGWGPQGSPAA